MCCFLTKDVPDPVLKVWFAVGFRCNEDDMHFLYTQKPG